VHFNTKYGDDLGSAIAGGKGGNDTLAVLGILFDKSIQDNEDLASMVYSKMDFRQ